MAEQGDDGGLSTRGAGLTVLSSSSCLVCSTSQRKLANNAVQYIPLNDLESHWTNHQDVEKNGGLLPLTRCKLKPSLRSAAVIALPR